GEATPTTAQAGAAKMSLIQRRSLAQGPESQSSAGASPGATLAATAESAAMTVRPDPTGTPTRFAGMARRPTRRKWQATMGAVATVAAALTQAAERQSSATRPGQPGNAGTPTGSARRKGPLQRAMPAMAANDS